MLVVSAYNVLILLVILLLALVHYIALTINVSDVSLMLIVMLVNSVILLEMCVFNVVRVELLVQMATR